jgi:hypothetical protein
MNVLEKKINSISVYCNPVAKYEKTFCPNNFLIYPGVVDTIDLTFTFEYFHKFS